VLTGTCSPGACVDGECAGTDADAVNPDGGNPGDITGPDTPDTDVGVPSDGVRIEPFDFIARTGTCVDFSLVGLGSEVDPSTAIRWRVTYTTSGCDGSGTLGDVVSSPDPTVFRFCFTCAGRAEVHALDAASSVWVVETGLPSDTVSGVVPVTIEPAQGDQPVSFTADNGRVRVLVPPGALTAPVTIGVAKAALGDHSRDAMAVGTFVGEPAAGTRVDRQALVVLPEGTTFEEPVLVEIELDASERGIPASALEGYQMRLVPLFRWDQDAWVRGGAGGDDASVESFAFLRSEGGKLYLAYPLRHFSSYTVLDVPSLDPLVGDDYGVHFFENYNVGGGATMLVPGYLFSNSAVQYVTLTSETVRRSRYFEVMRELVFETSRDKAILATAVPAELINGLVGDVLGCNGSVIGCDLAKDFTEAVDVLDDVGRFVRDEMVRNGNMTERVSKGFDGFSIWRTELDLEKDSLKADWTKYVAISQCLIEAVVTTALYIWSDHVETEQRWDALSEAVKGSPLWEADPAFRGAVADVEAFVATLRDDSLGAYLGSAGLIFADNLVGAPDNCIVEGVNLVSASLKKYLTATTGLAGFLVGQMFTIIKDYVLKDIGEATYNAEHLAALLTILAKGGLNSAFEAHTVKNVGTTAILQVPSHIDYFDDAERNEWNRMVVASRIAEMVSVTVQKTLQLEDVSWVSGKFRWMSDHLCLGCVNPAVYRDVLAEHYGQKYVDYAEAHDAIQKAFETKALITIPTKEEVCAFIGCDALCAFACGNWECGTDPICGQPCGTCIDGVEICVSGKCVPTSNCDPETTPTLCDGNILTACPPFSGGVLQQMDCTEYGYVCSWSDQLGYYFCNPPVAGCPESKDCSGRECGPDPVCGQSCGTCGVEEQCNNGTCAVVSTDITWISLPSGTFQMGSTEGNSDEEPVHTVTLSAFQMAKTETTVAQYAQCVVADACTAASTGWSYCNWQVIGREQHPINCVNWYQSTDFCAWAGARLCTEAEWEYAARSGGKDQTYPWGDAAATCDYAVMDDGGDGCGLDSTWAVCGKPGGNSDQGVCDLAGNVWEWVVEWYGTYPSAAETNPTGPASGSYRVIRGGSWYDDYADLLRASLRSGDDPDDHDDGLGLRCCRSSN